MNRSTVSHKCTTHPGIQGIHSFGPMDLFEGLVSYSLGKLEESLLSGGCLSLPVETVIHSATPYFYLRKKID